MRTHIVICGHSRAGTTLLHEVMRQSMPDWHFYDCEMPFDRAQHDKVVTKRPLDVMKFSDLQEYAENVDLKILLCIRDPKSMLTSYHKSVPGDYFYHADKQYFVPKAGRPSLTNPGLIPVHNAIMRLHQSDLNTEIVRYEDTLKRSYAPGQTPEKMARALNGDRPIDTSRIEAWKEHIPRLKNQFSQFPKLYEIMETYGYDIDGIA